MSVSPHIHAPLSRQRHAPETAAVSDAVHFSLGDLLALQADRIPHAPFLASPQHDGLTLNFSTAHGMVQNLQRQLALFKLEQGSTIALLMPNHPHASLACLACLGAGLHPLLLPAHGQFSELAGLMMRVPCSAIITSAFQDQSLPDMAMRLAAATDHVRFVTAFGHAPSKGIIALDPLMAAQPSHHHPIDDPASAILLPQPGGDIARVTVQALVAMATEHAADTGLDSGERLICPLAQTTVQGLCCGLISALMTGAELCLLDAPNSAALTFAMMSARPVHLVWPGRLEDMINDVPPGAIEAVTLVHVLPWERKADFPALKSTAMHVVDAWAFPNAVMALVMREAHNGARVPAIHSRDTVSAQTGDALIIAADGHGHLFASGVCLSQPGPTHDGWVALDTIIFHDHRNTVVAMEPLRTISSANARDTR